MHLAGTDISAQVIDLLAHPPAPDLTSHHNTALCTITEELLQIQRALTIAQWREIDEMVTRDGTRRAIDITTDWLHAHSALLLHEARTLVTMAVRMCADPALLHAYAAGDIHDREAKFITDYLAHPPTGMRTDPTTGQPRPPEEQAALRGAALDFLLLAAGARDMRVLRAEADKLSERLCGDIHPGDDIDRNRLEIAPYGTGHGRIRVRGDFDTVTGNNLLSALEPYLDTCREHDGSPDRRSTPRRQADAFSELMRRHQPPAGHTPAGHTDAEGAPTAAGQNAAGQAAESQDGTDPRAEHPTPAPTKPRITIHIPIEQLFGEIPTHAETCQMITDGRIQEVLDRTSRIWMPHMGSISLAAAQRLACDCELTMIGADIHGAPLTVNTTRRFASTKHRIALEGRDKGCAFPCCDRPAAWTQAHHMTPWELRHETQIDGLVLVCTAHHVAIHHQGWNVALAANRFPVFQPPARIDPLRRWLDSNGNHVDDPPHPETFFADSG